MPETEPVFAAPVPPGVWSRLSALADALGTSPGRLIAGSVAGVVVAGAVLWTLLASPGAPSGAADGALPRAAPPTTAAGAAPGAPGAEQVVVHVAGAAVTPGVYRLSGGARVADAVAAAGGPLPDADLGLVNLAAPVADGERVYVPRKGEQVPPEVAGAVGRGGGAGVAGPLNLNTATAEQLEALPGIGPSTAQAIVSWRRQHGRFRRVDDLLNVRGIGQAKLDALRDQVRV